MQAVLHRQPVSRAELARITGLSKQTTSEVMRALEHNGWVRVRGQIQGATGRSAVTYEVQRDAAFVLGIDLGGTKLHVALADLVGTITGETQEPTDPRGGAHVVRQIGAITQRLAKKAGLAEGSLRCAAVGSPGVFDPRTGHIDISPNIGGLEEIDVALSLSETLGCRVLIENDVNLAAKGEQWQGCCTDTQNFAFVAMGTGIGMGFVTDGQLVRGARGAAGEIAYLPLGGDPFDSRGYRNGTLETAIGSVAILERYRGFGGTEAADVRDVFDRLAKGDQAAEATLEETARVLVQALMAIRAVLDPERVVLGGSIGIRPELIGRVRDIMRRVMADPLLVEASTLGSRAALVGAVGVALAALHETMFGLTGLTPDGAAGHAS
jgi:predicted NBD/HSP70 family sugar kinase